MQEEINRVWDFAMYMQLMASFCNEIDFDEFNLFSQGFYEFIEKSSLSEINEKLPAYEEKLNSYHDVIKDKYLIKVDYRIIAREWNDLFKYDREILSNGIFIGWLEQFIDLKNYYKYDYYPYHFKIGLAIHKGKGDIEENFLLRDAFKCLSKAQKYLFLLKHFGEKQKNDFKEKGAIKFDNETLTDLNTIKSEISFYSILTVISFYSFLECYVNSIGFDIYYRRKNELNENEKDILRGSKKGRYLNLKYKIEAFQKIARSDKSAKIILSDNYQITEPFKTIFDIYEDLRNSAVHNSPEKTKIWIKPDDWFSKADEFSKLTIDAAKIIWKVCHETNKGADYLGRFEYKTLYDMALRDEKLLNELEKKWL
jgi:hypothetical protein